MKTYQLDKNIFSPIKDKQLSLLVDELTDSSKKHIIIDYQHRGYTVNDKIDEIIDSPIQSIGLFSGAGGLDIGAQLAGSKLISSLDFDKDV